MMEEDSNEGQLLDRESERDCPLCDKVHFVEKRKRIGEMLIKNEITSYEEVYFFCPESVDYEEDEFVSGRFNGSESSECEKCISKKSWDCLHLMRLPKFEDYME